jgi:anti-sigma-K factor RskA
VNPQEYINNGNIEAYALGKASPEEASLASEMCANYPEVEAYYSEVAAQLESLANLYAKPAPKRAKSRLFEAISAETQQTMIVSNTSITPEAKQVSIDNPIEAHQVSLTPWRLSVAASVAIAIFSIGGNIYFYNQLDSTKQALAETTRSNQTLASDIQKTSLERNKIASQLAMAADPFMPKVMLGGMNSGKDAKVLVVVDAKKNMAQIALKNMPKVPTEMDLQLWAIVDGKPVDLGILPTTEDGLIDYQIPNIEGATALAVTIESKGGHPQPQGEMILMGEIKL